MLSLAEEATRTEIALEAAVTDDLFDLTREILDRLDMHLSAGELFAVGHRVVHGGDRFAGPARITEDTLASCLSRPLHHPQSVRLIGALRRAHPTLPQFASFDTAFHRSQRGAGHAAPPWR